MAAIGHENLPPSSSLPRRDGDRLRSGLLPLEAAFPFLHSMLGVLPTNTGPPVVSIPFFNGQGGYNIYTLQPRGVPEGLSHEEAQLKFKRMRQEAATAWGHSVDPGLPWARRKEEGAKFNGVMYRLVNRFYTVSLSPAQPPDEPLIPPDVEQEIEEKRSAMELPSEKPTDLKRNKAAAALGAAGIAALSVVGCNIIPAHVTTIASPSPTPTHHVAPPGERTPTIPHAAGVLAIHLKDFNRLEDKNAQATMVSALSAYNSSAWAQEHPLTDMALIAGRFVMVESMDKQGNTSYFVVYQDGTNTVIAPPFQDRLTRSSDGDIITTVLTTRNGFIPILTYTCDHVVFDAEGKVDFARSGLRSVTVVNPADPNDTITYFASQFAGGMIPGGIFASNIIIAPPPSSTPEPTDTPPPPPLTSSPPPPDTETPASTITTMPTWTREPVTPTTQPTAWWSTDQLGNGPDAEKGRNQYHVLSTGFALPSHVVDTKYNNGPSKTFMATILGTVNNPEGKLLLQYAFFDMDSATPNKPIFFTSFPASTLSGTWPSDALKYIPPGLIYKVFISPDDFQKIMNGNNPNISIIGGVTMTLDNPGDAKPLFPAS